MATTYTANALIRKPATADRNWDVAMNANFDQLDGVAAIGRLAVTTTEIPSTTLNIRVTSGNFVKSDGTVATYAGSAAYAVPPSTSLCFWLTDAGVLTASTAFPATAHVRLAQVSTGISSVQSVSDERVGPQTCGTGLGFVLKSGDSVAGPFSVVSTASGGAALAVNPDGPALGFFGVAPAPPAPAVAPLVDNSTGAATNSVTDVGPSHNQTLLDGNFASLTSKVNALIAAMKRHGLMSS